MANVQEWQTLANKELSRREKTVESLERQTAEGIASLIDLGDRFRLLVNCIDTVQTPHSLPKLPVANALWKAQPDLPTASEAWILAGGAHHTVFSHALDLNDMRQFAEMHDIEIAVIDNDTRLPAFKDALRWNDVYYGFKR